MSQLSPSSMLEAVQGQKPSILCFCGESHAPTQHHLGHLPTDPVMAGAPQTLTEWINERQAMGHLRSTSVEEAGEIWLRDLLARATPSQRRICEILIELAGGMDIALASAFGPQAEEFFSNAPTAQFRRRDFLVRAAAAAAIVTLASCGQQPPAQPPTAATSPDAGKATAKLEKTELTIGFIPIACSIPILTAEAKGIYEKYGLKVTLKKMPNWAAVRDSAIAGELDAYHMLSPMPISISLGLGSAAFPIRLASIENINGQSIAVSLKHKDKVKGPADFKGLTLGVPFPFSMHNLLFRYYLASAGLNPDQDVKLTVVPPPDAIAKMSAGQIDGFLLPDNFGQRLVFEKMGFIHLLTKDLWSGHPCCAFAASQKWINDHPNTFRAVNKAIIEAAAYVNAASNRVEISKLMADRKYLNQPEPVLTAVMTGNFENGLGQTLSIPDRIGFDPYPWKSFAQWIMSQMVLWKLMPSEKADYAKVADEIYMTDLARELAKELGQTPPTEATKVEKLKFGDFDAAKIDGYLEEQRKKFGV